MIVSLFLLLKNLYECFIWKISLNFRNKIQFKIGLRNKRIKFEKSKLSLIILVSIFSPKHVNLILYTTEFVLDFQLWSRSIWFWWKILIELAKIKIEILNLTFALYMYIITHIISLCFINNFLYKYSFINLNSEIEWNELRIWCFLQEH